MPLCWTPPMVLTIIYLFIPPLHNNSYYIIIIIITVITRLRATGGNGEGHAWSLARDCP